MDLNHERYLADPGKARDCSINSFVINCLIRLVSHSFPPTALRRRHAQTVWDSYFSHKIEYILVIKTFFKSWRASQLHCWFKSYGHFTEGIDFPYWWSFIGKGLRSTGRIRLVFYYLNVMQELTRGSSSAWRRSSSGIPGRLAPRTRSSSWLPRHCPQQLLAFGKMDS